MTTLVKRSSALSGMASISTTRRSGRGPISPIRFAGAEGNRNRASGRSERAASGRGNVSMPHGPERNVKRDSPGMGGNVGGRGKEPRALEGDIVPGIGA